MPPDPLLQRLDRVDEACHEVVEELEQLRRAITIVRGMRRTGRSASEILEHGPGMEARRRVRARSIFLTEALHAYRAELVRSIVDNEGWSIAEVARTTHNARQVVSRLYHAASAAEGGISARTDVTRRKTGTDPDPRFRSGARSGSARRSRSSDDP